MNIFKKITTGMMPFLPYAPNPPLPYLPHLKSHYKLPKLPKSINNYHIGSGVVTDTANILKPEDYQFEFWI
jgi:hypothetical protein